MVKVRKNHGEASELLPWYVNGTLDEEQRLVVRDHVDECEECREDVAFLRNVNSAVNEASPSPIIPQPRVDEFFAAVDADSSGKQARSFLPRWAIAASLLIAALGALLVLSTRMQTAGDATRFETATSESDVINMDYVLSIRLQPETDPDTLNVIVRSLKARDVTADGEADVYRMIVTLPGGSLEEIETFTEWVETQSGVRSAAIVALQLPVSKKQ